MEQLPIRMLLAIMTLAWLTLIIFPNEVNFVLYLLEACTLIFIHPSDSSLQLHSEHSILLAFLLEPVHCPDQTF